MQRGLVGSEMCIRDSINAEYMGIREPPPKAHNAGKAYKGLAHQLHVRYPPEGEKVSELTLRLQESYDKIFQLKMEIMTLKKGALKVSKRNPNKSEIDTSHNDHTKDSENVAASYSFLPQLGSGRSFSKANIQFIQPYDIIVKKKKKKKKKQKKIENQPKTKKQRRQKTT
eukprot:TRINITY_DN5030_c0_g1_i1.p1 TRINITY_DN5030_c0_g1~~TRINITY_DN5030_c0_g1_i1.p1  ORF type:complete len:170 (-),score=40.29 TRINITY_DN5030_c0_g1_i1:81-590(-)